MKLATRLSLIVLIIAALFMMAACGGGCSTTTLSSTGDGGSGGVSSPGTVCGPGTGGGGGTPSAFFYYVGSSDIEAASLTTDGTFAPLTSVTPPVLPSSSGNDMIVVNKTFLYLPQPDSLTIQAFVIDHTTGALTAVAGNPFSTAAADSVTSDPLGRFLFLGNDTTGQISVFQINSTTGALTAAPGSPFSAFNLDFAGVLAVDGTGTFLYTGQGFSYLPVYGFSIDQNNGALAQITGSPFALGVAGVRTDFLGKFAVGLSGNQLDNNLYVFAIDSTTGALSPVVNSPFATTMSTPLNLRIHPTSQFVYSFGADSNDFYTSMEGFAIDSTFGTLTPLANSPFTILPIVFDCKFDQGGSAAFCGDALVGVNTFSVFNTNTATGDLTQTVLDLTVTNNAVPFVPTN